MLVPRFPHPVQNHALLPEQMHCHPFFPLVPFRLWCCLLTELLHIHETSLSCLDISFLLHCVCVLISILIYAQGVLKKIHFSSFVPAASTNYTSQFSFINRSLLKLQPCSANFRARLHEARVFLQICRKLSFHLWCLDAFPLF